MMGKYENIYGILQQGLQNFTIFLRKKNFRTQQNRFDKTKAAWYQILPQFFQVQNMYTLKLKRCKTGSYRTFYIFYLPGLSTVQFLLYHF
jgi:hypothetical protein